MKEEIKEIAESLKHDITEFTREIIAIPSFTGEEGPVVARIKKEMEKIGYDNIRIDGMGNLIGQIGSGKKILAIDGHVDTVEIGDPKSWQHDPFTGKLENGIIFGRGACDQKGGLASAIYAGKILQEIGLPDDITLLVVASVQEELYEGLNWQYIIKEEKIVPDAVILTEPSNLAISIGHRGRIDIKVQTKGVTCHGADPDRGENAIYKIAPIVLDVEKLHEKLPSDPIFGKGSITVTDIRSTSPSINAVADSATIHVDRRLNTDDTMESVIKEIEALSSVQKAKATIFVPEYEVKSHTGLVCPIKAYYASWSMDKFHPFVRTAMKAYNNQFDAEPILRYWRFSTNGVATNGIFNIPTIGFGPGDEKYAHTTEDQVPVEHLIKAMEFYASFVKFLGKEQ